MRERRETCENDPVTASACCRRNCCVVVSRSATIRADRTIVLYKVPVAIGKFMDLFISILSSQSKRLVASTSVAEQMGNTVAFRVTELSKLGSTCIGRLHWKNRGTLLVRFDFLRPGMVFVELVTGA
jgi:hypothetical protein